MENKKLKGFLIAGSLLALLVGIGIYVKVNINKVMNFCYRFTGFKLTSFSKDAIKFELKVKLKNTSNFKINLSSYKFKVYINKIYLGTIEQELTTEIAKQGISEFFVPVNVSPSKTDLTVLNIADIALKIPANKKSVLFKIDGTISGKVGIIKVDDFPIQMEYSLEEILAPSTDEDICKDFK